MDSKEKREQELRDQIDFVIKTFDDWSMDTESALPSEGFLTGLKELSELIASDFIPKEYEVCIEFFRKAYDSISGQDADMILDNMTFWYNYQEFVRTFRGIVRNKRRQEAEPERIEELKRQGVRATQICYIYGFVYRDEFGSITPDFQRLREEEERQKAGIARDYEVTAEKELSKLSAIQDKNFSLGMAEVENKRKSAKRPKTRKKIEDCFDERMPLAQIGLITGLSDEEIRQEAERLGVNLDRYGREKLPDSVVVSIQQLIADGKSYAEVIEELSTATRELTESDIKEVMAGEYDR